MKKQIITVSRTFGSGGRTVGKMVAERLQIPYYDRELIELVAEKTGFHEDFVEKHAELAPYTNAFAYAFIGRGPNGASNADILWHAQSKIIHDLAEKGPCVIVGRCADYLLKNREDCLHTFIYADREFCAHRIVKLYGETDDKPEKRLEEKDKKRRVNYGYYTGRTWGDPQNYHMMLNTGALGVENCADLIVSAVQSSI